jgi:hypothetical protein
VRELAALHPEWLDDRTAAGYSTIELARAKGVVGSVVVLRRVGVGGALETREAADLVESLVCEISQSHTGAGWDAGIEFELWRSVTERQALPDEIDPCGYSRLPPGLLDDLKFLADLAGGWPAYGRLGVSVVPLAVWENDYESWRRRQQV